MENHIEDIERVIRFQLNKVSYKDREDLKQEILLKVYEYSLKTQIQSFKAITRVISKACIVDYYRYKSKAINVNTFSCEVVAEIPARGGGELKLIELEEDFRLSKDIFSKNEAKVIEFLFSHTEDVNNSKDIAKELKLSVYIVCRALKKLRSIA